MEMPPRVEYSLTESGRDLIVALKELANWGKKMRKIIILLNEFNYNEIIIL